MPGIKLKRKKKKSKQVYGEALATLTEVRSPMAEAYRTLRTNINYAVFDQELKVLLITSPQPGDGKSTTVSNTAVVIAQAGQRTLLIDCDFRKPTVHKIFGLANNRGLTNLISEGVPLEQVVQSTNIDNLEIITCGPIPPNPAEMLSSRRMSNFLASIRSQYDRIIIDSPPTGAVTDAAILSSQVDGVLLVVKSGHTQIQVAQDAREKLLHANAHIVGVILNGLKRNEGGYYNYYYYGHED